MSDLFDLLPVPAERGLPAGRLEQRAAALVSAVEADLAGAAARRGRLRVLRSWLMSLSLFVAVLAVVATVVFAGGSRENTTRIAAGTAVVLAGGSGLAALAVAPRPPRLAH